SSMIFVFWMGTIVQYAGSFSLMIFSFSAGAAKLRCTGGAYDASGTFAKG
ncbi:hypothetical protein L208DRAFT_1266648, partial [Tricholoma matsutake]